MLRVTCFVVFLFSSAAALDYLENKDTGYHRGLMSDCPGSWKPAKISRNTLKKLSVSVLGNRSRGLTENLITYNYYHSLDLSRDPELDFSKKTILYVPGYLDTSVMPAWRQLARLYKNLGYNVLVLDYQAFTEMQFPIAARLMRPVGKHTAEILANLTTHGLDPKKLEIVGFSLGGQLMSFIAKNYREITGKNISSLTALDPAGRCFRHLGPDQRLDPSDADFVLVVSTNIDGYGMATPVGHVTFYVNGGEFQPSDIWFVPCESLCSHIKAHALWISALINPGYFIGMQCDSIQQARNFDCYDRKPLVTNTMDLTTDRSKPGIYYLSTFNRYPLYLGRRGLKRSGEMIMKQLGSLNTDDMMVL